ncbi:hypothetical protein JCM5350_000581 [Sporobolomyces pararoseus]
MSTLDTAHSDTDTDSDSGSLPSPFNSSPSQFNDFDNDLRSISRRASGKQEVPERVGNFVLQTHHKLDSAPITIYKWESEKTGLKVVWADVASLISTFSTTVVTEIFDDSGCPHTKEHLTFTASENFPYSSVLFAIAGRLLSNDINAETAVDHTTYTFDSASDEGMLEMVPVYLDHIFFPLLTESIFKTEIYHINGKGEEGGTVFSEMQGIVSSPEEVMGLAESRALYETQNGYRSETGGRLENLRKLTLAKIIAYHKKYYVPQNVTVVITGQSVDPRRLLTTINQEIEPRLVKAGLARGYHPRDWIRPFVESSTAKFDPVISKDEMIQVPWPDSEGTTGKIGISWVGPELRDSITVDALKVLGSYLFGGPTAIVRKKYVEGSNPACAEMGFDIDSRDPVILQLSLDAVPKERLSTLGHQVKMTLGQVCREQIDMKSIKLVLKHQKLKHERKMETHPSEYISDAILPDIIYGNDNGSDLAETFDHLQRLNELERWSEHDWVDLLKEFLVERHSITLVGTPSAQLAEQEAHEGDARVKENIRKFGRAGLAQLDKALKQAEKKNLHPAPASLLEEFPVPDFKEIEWLPVGIARSNGIAQGRRHFTGETQDFINSDRSELPFFVQFEDVDSNFVTVSAFLTGAAQPIANLYVASFFSMPLETAQHRMLTYEDVRREMSETFVDWKAELSQESICVTLTASRKDYAKAITWLSDLLHGTTFDLERVKNLVHRKLADLPEAKENGAEIAEAAVSSLLFCETSYETTWNPIYQLKYYEDLKKRLEDNPKSVINELRKFRKSLLDPRSLRFSVVGDISSLDRPAQNWLDCLETSVKPLTGENVLIPFASPRALLTPLGSKPARVALLYQLDSSESTFLDARSRCPDWSDPEYAALALACQVLSSTNGLIWGVTRSAGLCYGAWITANVESGTISLSIFRSPDAIVARAAIQDLVMSIADGTKKIAVQDLDGARSQLAFDFVKERSTLTKAASQSFYDTVVLDRPADYPRKFLAQLQLVTTEDIQNVVKHWILPLFDPSTSIVGTTSGRNKKQALVNGLTKLGYSVEERRL